MTSLTLSFFGPPEQKHVVKVPPMQTLKDALRAASTKFRPALDVDSCQLHHNKKAVDLNTPFRLLNIAAGSKLEIIKQAIAGPTAATMPAGAAAASASTSSAAPAVSAVAGERPSAPAAMASEQASPPAAPVAAPPATPGPSNRVQFNEEPPNVALTTATIPVAAAAPAATTAGPAAIQPELAALGIQRTIYVFHHKVLEAAAEAAARKSRAMDIDPPDEYFELTADDLARMQQQANAKKQQEAVFRTRAAREAEEARAAAAMGPVRVRLHFPDGTLLQAEFKATDPLAAVQDLVGKCAAAQYAQALYLYTTPPKTVLKDSAATLYSLKLVPAAHIHVGVDEKKAAAAASGGPSSYLRPEVQALMQDHVPEQQQQQQEVLGMADSSRGGSDAAAVAEAQRAMRAAAAASRAEARGGDAQGGSKVPIWLKVGKK